MKRFLIIAAAAVAAAELPAADESTTITPAKPGFQWIRDEEGVPLERDPLTPTDFVWPRPRKSTNDGSARVVKGKSQLVLAVEFISIGPNERFAKVTGMAEFLEVGREYTFMTVTGNATFKVEKIEVDKVIVNHDGEIPEFSPKTIPEHLKGKQF